MSVAWDPQPTYGQTPSVVNSVRLWRNAAQHLTVRASEYNRHMADNLASLEAEEAKLLQSALSTAFSPADLPRESPSQPPAQPSVAAESTAPAVEMGDTSSSASDDSWKAEYESHVETWRTQSAEAREKAEKERERWEAIRKAEREEEAARHKGDHGWETVEQNRTVVDHPTGIPARRGASPSPADVRDLVTGEPQGVRASKAGKFSATGPSLGVPGSSQATHLRQETGEDSKFSQKWEDIASEVTSSFPSMSFPERSETPSPSARDHPSSQHPPPPPPAPLSATLAVFDSSLSPRTRVSALFSSFAINVLLPFVNGVMLGFGEIFAKNVVIGWLGWKVPGLPIASTVGLGVPLPSEQRQSRRRSS